MSLLVTLPDAQEAPPATQPSHLRAYALYCEACREVRSLEERDVRAIAVMQNQGAEKIAAEELRYIRVVAELERDLENARLAIDYIHARGRQTAAYERFMALLEQAAAPEREQLRAEMAARA